MTPEEWTELQEESSVELERQRAEKAERDAGGAR